MNIEVTEKKRPYNCICGASFGTLSILTTHIELLTEVDGLRKHADKSKHVEKERDAPILPLERFEMNKQG